MYKDVIKNKRYQIKIHGSSMKYGNRKWENINVLGICSYIICNILYGITERLSYILMQFVGMIDLTTLKP